MDEVLAVPPPTHLIYIPAILLVGIVIGFIMGRKAGVREGKAEFIAGDDDDLI